VISRLGAESLPEASPEPFEFATASYLTRINNQKATTLQELLAGIEQASDASIFYHTFQSLGQHHFLTEGFSNDFAQWVLAGLNRPELAEQLAGIDIRDYISLPELRADIRRLVAAYCAENPRMAEMSSFEPFYFSETVEVVFPAGRSAGTLEQFHDTLQHLGHTSLYYHFIASRLRLQLQTNDFSHWLSQSLGMDDLARRINRIDIYTNTLDSARDKMTELIEGELRA